MEGLYDPPELEYLGGRAFPKVSPKRTHSLVQRAVLSILERCAQDYGEFGAEWRFRVGVHDGTSDSFLPDVGFISFERLSQLSDEEAEEPPCAPDVAIEVRSPSSHIGLLKAKIQRYLQTGALLVLDIDPQKRTVVAHCAEGTKEFTKSDRFEHDAAPWLTFDVTELFANLNRRSR